jgi:hypothetical protein
MRFDVNALLASARRRTPALRIRHNYTASKREEEVRGHGTIAPGHSASGASMVGYRAHSGNGFAGRVLLSLTRTDIYTWTEAARSRGQRCLRWGR